ncbi:MAG: hypothetical protein FD146_1920 [Anaerolineaceae bacterium]|nr:MAG: hypothetical protein FD146_1920 [Anaerolineaceae bacterium]
MNRTVEIVNWSAPLPRPIRALYCNSFLCRLRGLMFRSRLAPDEGLLLVQPRENRLDASIHMFFVFTNLAVIWLNTDGEVVDTVLARAWRPAYFPGTAARYILEIPPDRLGEFNVGDKIKFE